MFAPSPSSGMPPSWKVYDTLVSRLAVIALRPLTSVTSNVVYCAVGDALSGSTPAALKPSWARFAASSVGIVLIRLSDSTSSPLNVVAFPSSSGFPCPLSTVGRYWYRCFSAKDAARTRIWRHP